MRIGVTGYRAADLGGYYLPNQIYNKVCQEVQKHFLELKPDLVFTGMALGFDSWVANICNKLSIRFLAAIPFLGQERKQGFGSLMLKKARELSKEENICIAPWDAISHNFFSKHKSSSDIVLSERKLQDLKLTF